MVASTSDLFKKVATSTVTTLASPGKALAATSITVGSTTNYPTDTGVVVAIRVVSATGELVAGTYTEWSATVSSGTTLAIAAVPVYGSDQVYPAGSTTQVFVPVSSYAQNKLIDGLVVQHTQTGTHKNITTDTLVASSTIDATGGVSDKGTPLETIRSEVTFDHVASGCVWSGDSYGSTLNASMTTGSATANVVYIGGQRGVLSNVTARAFTASKDTYIDVLKSAGVFSLVYTEVANNAASPVLAANSIRQGIIVTGATNIAAVGSVTQGLNVIGGRSGFDSNSYPIYPVASSLVVGRSIRTSTSTTGISGTNVNWNGMMNVPFRGKLGRTYRLTIHEPILDGFTGSGFTQFTFYISSTTGGGTGVSIIRSTMAVNGSGVDGSFEFAAAFTGLQYINIFVSMTGLSGTMQIQGTATYPAFYTVTAV